MFRTKLNPSKKNESGGFLGASNRKIKKGAGASPLSSTDPPKPEHSRGCVPATPGSQYFICELKMQVGCQAMVLEGFRFIRLKQWELGSGNSLGNCKILQNLTDEIASLSI